MKAFLVTAMLALAVSPQFASCAPPPGQVVRLGSAPSATTGTPSSRRLGVLTIGGEPLTNIVAVSGGESHALALKGSGRVVGWGFNYYGQATVPAGLNNVIAVSAGENHSLALKSNGTVVGWGDNTDGQTGVPSDLTNVSAIAAGWHHSLALKSDGTVVVWGSHRPVPVGLTNIVAIATGDGNQERNLALRQDGAVVAWGSETISSDATPPRGMSSVIAVAAGRNHSLALTKDGNVIGWGFNGSGQATGVPTGKAPYTASGLVTIAGELLSNVVAIAAGNEFSLALKRDGVVVAWGSSRITQQITSAPAALSNIIAIAAGANFGLAITTNSAVVIGK